MKLFGYLFEGFLWVSLIGLWRYARKDDRKNGY